MLPLNRRTLIKLLGASGGVSVLAACGSETVGEQSASSTETAGASSSVSAASLDAGASLADIFSGESHELKLTVSEENLQAVLDSWQSEGTKEWVEGTVTFDGVEIERVGLRLKGNSTLKQLTSSDQESGPGGMDSGISVDDPTTWPFLLDFDKYVDDRVFQGYSRLSIRPGAPVLNEALALRVTAETDQPSQKFTYIRYTLNDKAETSRLLIVVPDKYYAQELGDGILYKADAESSFSYQGDDPATYTEQFKQLNGDDDMTPIINLLKWVDQASDEEFATQINDYVDVDSFARYLATQNLLVNTDDISGPGKNYHLWYDRSTGLISIISWDLNLAMQSDTSAGPDDQITMGGGAAPGGGAMLPPTGVSTGANTYAPTGGGMSQGNALKERFLAQADLKEIYYTAYWDLNQKIYTDGLALDNLSSISQNVPATSGLSQEDIDSAKETLQVWVESRKAALEALAG